MQLRGIWLVKGVAFLLIFMWIPIMHVHAQSVTSVVSVSKTSTIQPPPRRYLHFRYSFQKKDTHTGPWMPFVATWYDGDGSKLNGNKITSTGKRVKKNYTIAVDPKVIPYFSMVEIKFPNGKIKTFYAEDTGGAIRGNRVDIYNPSRTYCIDHGIKHVLLRIVSEP